MSAVALKERLRADLKAAMQARSSDDVRVLRSLIAAVDNAEAVPGEHKNIQRAFGDPGSEVARRELDGEDLAALLEREIEERLAAAAGYGASRPDAATRLRAEAALIAGYRAV
jgi:uncharacterized protein YqeY